MFPTSFISKCCISLRKENADWLFLYAMQAFHVAHGWKKKKAKLHKFCQALKIVVFFVKPTINLIYKNRVLGSRNYKNHNLQKNPAIPVRKSNIFPISAFRFYQS